MDKQSLRDLSAKKIINMTNLFREIGETPDYMFTMMGRPRTVIKKDILEKAENKLTDIITDIVQTADISLEKVIARLLSDLSQTEQNQVYDNMDAIAVEPIGYVEREDSILAIYLPKDRYRPRKSQHESETRFMELSQVMNFPRPVDLTGRGREQIRNLAEKAEA